MASNRVPAGGPDVSTGAAEEGVESCLEGFPAHATVDFLQLACERVSTHTGR